MILRDSTWDKIRNNFSQEEKISLAANVTGRIICPAAICIDVNNLPDELEHKFVGEVANAGG